MSRIYEHKVAKPSGEEVSLRDFEGDVMLIVNTASKCGLTPQFKGLQELHEALEGRGLRVLGFPCNQFGQQDPGTNDEIQSFCQVNYGVSFEMFAKVDVNGAGAHPLYKFLKKEAKGTLGTEWIKWNFTKFLVDRTGKVVARYAPSKTPAALRKKIEAVL